MKHVRADEYTEIKTVCAEYFQIIPGVILPTSAKKRFFFLYEPISIPFCKWDVVLYMTPSAISGIVPPITTVLSSLDKSLILLIWRF
ncbi:MAG: hypothetical protein MZW92_44075 [Comamonadaceae bacterium]|nr:hypothetical protein [Comamonadaceae bacterium]